MNEYDSNRIYDSVSKLGFVKTTNQSNADCYILNTCHIRDKAKEKVYHEIGRVKKLYRDKNMIDQMTVDRINNQIDTYISYIEQKDYEKEFSRKSSEIFIDALSPMKHRLPKNFFSDMAMIIDDLEKEFEKNTNLMLDGFTFSVAIPGDLRDTNATFISENDNTIYWEFDFDDIATSHFNMYAHSIVINNLSLQLLLLIILLVFIGFIWKKRLKIEMQL